jgi:hypothetical protein
VSLSDKDTASAAAISMKVRFRRRIQPVNATVWLNI